MKKFEGKVLFLDRSDINTDEIIPAKYLTEISLDALKPHLLEDLDIPGFSVADDIAGKGVVLSRENFGCGSSREHAPRAFEVNGINVVIAESFARIFRQNMYNCGMIAIELPKDKIEDLFNKYANSEAYVSINVDKSEMRIKSDSQSETLKINLAGFERDLVLAGGWVEYVDKKY